MHSNHSLPYYEVAREPPPYPAILKPFCQPGYRQSYSGSEASTDFSLSSTENLSISARQEPQGEETFQRSSPYYLIENSCVQDPAIVSSASYGLQGSSQGRQDGVEVKSTQGAFYVTGSSMQQQQAPSTIMQNYQTLEVPTTSVAYSSLSSSPVQCLYNTTSKPNNQRSPNQSNSNIYSTNSSPKAMSDYAAESAMVRQYRLAPPQYPGAAMQHQLQYTMNEKKELQRSYEILDKLQLTRSQPDLTQLVKYSAVTQPFDFQLQPNSRQQMGDAQFTPKQSPRLSRKSAVMSELDLDHAAIANRATQLVEMLTEENKSLRDELDNLYHKVSRMQKMEGEIQKINDAHESLVKQAAKREKLEAAMRKKLEQDLGKQHEVNRSLKSQLQRSLSQLPGKDPNVGNVPDVQLSHDLEKKESTINKLMEKNKELTATKERLEIELAAQRSTLQEQRKHIEVLDKAFSNAQSNVLKLEEEICKKQEQGEKIEQLQKALSSVQGASAKREMLEQKLRSKMEEEIWLLKMKQTQQSSGGKSVDHDEGIASDTEAPTSVQALLQQLHEKEQHILNLESEILQWKQKYLEECALRQLAIDAETMPKMVRIAALEQSSLETEKIITVARAERLNHLEEVYQANVKCADMETKLNNMQAKLAEKDAVIKVLQKHSPLNHSLSSLLCASSPLHSRKTSDSSQLSVESSHRGSMLDISLFKSSVHNRSSSTGSSGVSSIGGKDSQLRQLQSKASALLLDEDEDDQLTSRLWQV